MLDDGRPFHAHEVFEDAWKAAPSAQRELWRGLAQLAVGLTHAARGNPRGADALLRRGADSIRSYSDTARCELNVAGLLEWSGAAALAVRAGGPIPVMPPLRYEADHPSASNTT